MKRFTETTKWRDVWFAALPTKYKLAWLWVLDACDHAGVVDANVRAMAFDIGEQIDEREFIAAMQGKVVRLTESKWHVPRFVAFQWGELSEDCRPHQKVFKQLKAHGIDPVSGQRVFDTLSDTLSDRVSGTLEEEVKEEVEVVSKVQTNQIESDELEAIWREYPKKVGKREALPVIKLIVRERGFDFILQRVKAYAAAVSRWPADERRFIPDPVRWFKRGRYDDDDTAWIRNGNVGNARLATVNEEDHRNGF